jgi:F420-0:gamma-glutamyl ligase
MNICLAHKIMWALSVMYGVAIGIIATLGDPVGTVAWIGAVGLGLGWSFSSVLTRRDASY